MTWRKLQNVIFGKITFTVCYNVTIDFKAFAFIIYKIANKEILVWVLFNHTNRQKLLFKYFSYYCFICLYIYEKLFNLFKSLLVLVLLLSSNFSLHILLSSAKHAQVLIPCFYIKYYEIKVKLVYSWHKWANVNLVVIQQLLHFSNNSRVLM